MNYEAGHRRGGGSVTETGAGRLVRDVRGVSRHRNGIGGAPFWAVLFTHDDDEGRERLLVATVFDREFAVAVVSADRLAAGEVDERWRGDRFEPELRAAIARHEEETP
jgi:hypothetical protein